MKDDFIEKSNKQEIFKEFLFANIIEHLGKINW